MRFSDPGGLPMLWGMAPTHALTGSTKWTQQVLKKEYVKLGV